MALSEEVPPPQQISSPEIARSSPEFHEQISVLKESFQEVQDTAIKSCLTPHEQQGLHKLEEQKIRGQFEQLKKQMESTGQDAIKLSRRATQFSSSYIVTKEGQIFRQLHTKSKELEFQPRVIKETVPVTPEEKTVGEGGIKKVSSLSHQGDESHVIGIAKRGLDPAGKEIKVTENSIQAAKEFSGNPLLAAGHYITWTSAATHEKREGFIDLKAEGSLETRAQEGLKPEEISAFILGAAKALNEVHKAGWAHRDIKADNFLVKDLEIKLADFDFAIKSEDDDRKVGSPFFMAPEIVNTSSYNPQKADIFALGATFYEIINGGTPLADFNADTGAQQLEFMGKLTYNDLEAMGLPEPEEKNTLDHLIWEMVNPEEPEKRPSIEEVVRRLPALLET